ncbi:hypothetical protein FRAAL4617 [Frankia alni ACN14a]|uniref:Uncharacterized protein n=1 Tax=Frankia alni (strain DSM 45986 / CECT 9034 / ACN14a) TaxID=326424 RepID=Q0RGX7_FRAAA|nr:hypothetical protein FRAAL4617 [Frankia alni ACN14a]
MGGHAHAERRPLHRAGGPVRRPDNPGLTRESVPAAPPVVVPAERVWSRGPTFRLHSKELLKATTRSLRAFLGRYRRLGFVATSRRSVT